MSFTFSVYFDKSVKRKKIESQKHKKSIKHTYAYTHAKHTHIHIKSHL